MDPLRRRVRHHWWSPCSGHRFQWKVCNRTRVHAERMQVQHSCLIHAQKGGRAEHEGDMNLGNYFSPWLFRGLTQHMAATIVCAASTRDGADGFMELLVRKLLPRLKGISYTHSDICLLISPSIHSSINPCAHLIIHFIPPFMLPTSIRWSILYLVFQRSPALNVAFLVF